MVWSAPFSSHLSSWIRLQIYEISRICANFLLCLNVFYPLILPYSVLHQIICAFSCISHRFFVPLHHQTTINGQNYSNYSNLLPKQNHHATKPVFNYGANTVGPNVLSLHPTQVCLGETEVTLTGRSRPRASYKVEAPHVSSGRSKHYLPTSRAAVSCPFLAVFAPLTFLRLNLDFAFLKLRLYRQQTLTLL